MKTGRQWCEEHGLDTSKGSVSGAEFDRLRIPMVVRCTGCEMSMTILSPSVRVDDRDYVWCKECGGDEDEV